MFRKLFTALCMVIAPFTVALLFLSTPQNAFADECKLINYRFKGAVGPLDKISPNGGVEFFFKGIKNFSSRKQIDITTNNAPECVGKTIHFSIYPQNRAVTKAPLKNFSNKSYVLKNAEGTSIHVQTSEEACYNQSPVVFKSLIENEIKINPGKAADLKSQLAGAPDLLIFLFPDDYKDKPDYVKPYMFAGKVKISAKAHFLIKYMLANTDWHNPDGSVSPKTDCGYFLYAYLGDTPVGNSDNLNTAENRNAGRYISYMCNPMDNFKTGLELENSLFGTTAPVTINTSAASSVPREFNDSALYSGCNYGSNNAPWVEVSASAGGSVGLDQSIDTTDPCLDANGNQKNDCYELLAPIPGMGDIIHFEGTSPTATDPGTPPFDLFVLFSKLLTITLGSLSVIAVIMLVYIGSQYIISSKSGEVSKLLALRSRLVGVITGIGIILGSYIILNTINPDLLRLNPTLEDVNLQYDIKAVQQSINNVPVLASSTNCGGNNLQKKTCATGYHPGGYKTAAEAAMEGGSKDMRGKPLYTLQNYVKLRKGNLATGNVPYVSIALDNNLYKSGQIQYGQKFSIPELDAKYGMAIEFRAVDTGSAFAGKGLSRVDICTDSASDDAAVTGWITLVPKK